MRVLLAALAAPLIFLPVSPTAHPDPAGCGRHLNTRGCGDHGQIIVSGSRGGRASAGGSGRDTAPVGAQRYVDCGPGAPARLRALGDRTATLDVSTECSPELRASCREMLYAHGVPAGQQGIGLRKLADGTWQWDGSACRIVRPPLVTAAVRQQAKRLIPKSALGIAPQSATLVNIQTLLWVDAPQTLHLKPATIIGHQVSITLRFRHVAYDFGDGGTDTSTSAGKAYDDRNDPCNTKLCPDYYGHIYTRTGMRTITATVSWSASFTVDGGTPTTIPGDLAGPPARVTIHVRQARAVLVPNPTGN